MLKDIKENLNGLHEDKSVQGLIITSNVNKIFSAGLDITEMYQPDEERLRTFWTTLQEVWMGLYGSRLATAAAITGHAPAGGCLISMCCDYRVMNREEHFKIGLNETKLGIVAPQWFADTMRNTIGQRETEMALMAGTMYSPTEAASIGLVDEIVDADQVESVARKKIDELVRIPAHARHESKMRMREECINRLAESQSQDTDKFVSFCMQPMIQKGLGAYMESLKKKK